MNPGPRGYFRASCLNSRAKKIARLARRRHPRGVVITSLLGHDSKTSLILPIRRIELYTNAAMRENVDYYPHLGYEETGRHEEDGFQRVFFRKALDTK